MAWFKQTPFPELTTDRLVIRKLVEEDKNEIFALRSNELVNEFLDRPKNIIFDDAVAFIDRVVNGMKEGKSIYWAISLKTNPELIGTICLWNFSYDLKIVELGYELLPLHQNKGLMNEAVNCVIIFAFERLNVKQIDAISHKDNVSSRKLLERNKFQLDAAKKDKENSDYVVYSLANI